MSFPRVLSYVFTLFLRRNIHLFINAISEKSKVLFVLEESDNKEKEKKKQSQLSGGREGGRREQCSE
jgi:hypothetical protein